MDQAKGETSTIRKNMIEIIMLVHLDVVYIYSRILFIQIEVAAILLSSI